MYSGNEGNGACFEVKRNYHLLAFPALIIIALDQITKLIVVRTLHIHESVPVINGFFNLVHIRNRGMAFGLMSRSGSDLSLYFLIGATIGAVILLIFWFRKLKSEDRKIIIGLSLILGGAVGNLIDRLRLKEVIDFLDFYLAQYHWPAFNVADSAITIGTFWLVISILFRSPSNS